VPSAWLSRADDGSAGRRSDLSRASCWCLDCAAAVAPARVHTLVLCVHKKCYTANTSTNDHLMQCSHALSLRLHFSAGLLRITLHGTCTLAEQGQDAAAPHTDCSVSSLWQIMQRPMTNWRPLPNGPALEPHLHAVPQPHSRTARTPAPLCH
jgi:hypothetical protein